MHLSVSIVGASAVPSVERGQRGDIDDDLVLIVDGTVVYKRHGFLILCAWKASRAASDDEELLYKASDSV